MFVAAWWPAAAVFDAMVRRLTRAVASRDPLDEGSSVRFFGGTPGQVRCCLAGGRVDETHAKKAAASILVVPVLLLPHNRAVGLLR